MRDDELERLIDAGLNTYAEPRAGIEGRVLAAVAAEKSSVPRRLKPRRFWRLFGTTKVVPLHRAIVGRLFGTTKVVPLQNAWRPALRFWVAGLSAAVCVLVAVLVGGRFKATPHTKSEQAVTHVPAPAVRHTIPPGMVARTPIQIASSYSARKVDSAHKMRREEAAQIHQLPKRELFPSAGPLNPDVQALLHFAAEAPEKERQSLVQAQASVDAPIEIAPLHIEPLNQSSKD